MSRNRSNRRKKIKGKQKFKSDISRKDKIIGIFALIIVFLIAAAAAVYYSLYRSGLTLF